MCPCLVVKRESVVGRPCHFVHIVAVIARWILNVSYSVYVCGNVSVVIVVDFLLAVEIALCVTIDWR